MLLWTEKIKRSKQVTIMNLSLQWKIDLSQLCGTCHHFANIIEYFATSIDFKLLYIEAFFMTNYKSKSEFSNLVTILTSKLLKKHKHLVNNGEPNRHQPETRDYNRPMN